MKACAKTLADEGLRVLFDDRDTHRAGWKFAEYEAQGVPLRLALGPKDLENNRIEVARRDTKEKQSLPRDQQLVGSLQDLLADIQKQLLVRARTFVATHTHQVDSYEAFRDKIAAGGWVMAHWDGSTETEARIQEETRATLRCIPIEGVAEAGKCVYTGRPSKRRVAFARAY